MELHKLQVGDIVKYEGPFKDYVGREFVVINPCGCNGDSSRVEVADAKTGSVHGLVREHLRLVHRPAYK